MKFAVIFDMDGVIIDSNPYHKKSWKVFCQKHDIVLDETEWENKIFGRTGSESLKILLDKELSDDEIKSYCDEISVYFRNIASEIKPLDGLVNFLNALNQNNIKYAMATSAPPENVKFVLEKTGLSDYFVNIIDDTKVKNSKPNPEVFLKAAELLNISPDKCVVFEDSHSGIQAANSAGMKIIAVTTTHPAENLFNIDMCINDFYDININKILQLFNI